MPNLAFALERPCFATGRLNQVILFSLHAKVYHLTEYEEEIQTTLTQLTPNAWIYYCIAYRIAYRLAPETKLMLCLPNNFIAKYGTSFSRIILERIYN